MMMLSETRPEKFLLNPILQPKSTTNNLVHKLIRTEVKYKYVCTFNLRVKEGACLQDTIKITLKICLWLSASFIIVLSEEDDERRSCWAQTIN